MEYAPIVIFVYKRLEQTKKTFQSLMKNELAKVSKIYIYADGAKNDDEKKSVKEVRNYIHSPEIKNAFKEVIIKEQDKNCGLAQSIITGVSHVILEYKKVIVVEDDIETSPYFLNYMNECLTFYQDDKRIWSVSGYSPQLRKLDKYDENVYLCYRASTWGWGTWLDRWETVDWQVRDYQRFRFNLKWRAQFCRGGNDMPSMLKAQMNGRIDSWGIRWCYSQSRQNMLSVAPKISLVRNNGFDGTGTHSSTDDNTRFKSDRLENQIREWKIDNLFLDRRICRELYCLNSIPIWKRVVEKIKDSYF